jgi:hypothetical protein
MCVNGGHSRHRPLMARDGRLRIGYERRMLSRVSSRAAGFLRLGLPPARRPDCGKLPVLTRTNQVGAHRLKSRPGRFTGPAVAGKNYDHIGVSSQGRRQVSTLDFPPGGVLCLYADGLVAWSGRHAVVTMPAEMDITNASGISDQLATVTGQSPEVGASRPEAARSGRSR